MRRAYERVHALRDPSILRSSRVNQTRAYIFSSLESIYPLGSRTKALKKDLFYLTHLTVPHLLLVIPAVIYTISSSLRSLTTPVFYVKN